MFAPSIGVDLMGAERDPKEILECLFLLLPWENLDFSLHLFGSAKIKELFLQKRKHLPKKKWPVYHVCKSVIEMDDLPLKAVKTKQDSSLCKALMALKKGDITACISCANTGAMVSFAKLLLPMIPGIERPALAANIPTKIGHTTILDVGANAAARENHLLQFALMGAAYQKTMFQKKPRVALLNVGREAYKGNLFLRKCYELLETPSKQYVFLGNIEPKELLEGKLEEETVDVVVTDGLTGNLFLKTLEAIVEHLPQQGKNREEEGKSKLPPHPGALLLGPSGLIIKCHGGTTVEKIASSIYEAVALCRRNLISKIPQFL